VIAVSGRPLYPGDTAHGAGASGDGSRKGRFPRKQALFHFALQRIPANKKGIARRDAFDRHAIAESGIT
jgi:hypothetical protein